MYGQSRAIIITHNLLILNGLLFQSSDDLNELLTADGVRQLHKMCYRNLDMTAQDKEEAGMLDKFMVAAKEV